MAMPAVVMAVIVRMTMVMPVGVVIVVPVLVFRHAAMVSGPPPGI